MESVDTETLASQFIRMIRTYSLNKLLTAAVTFCVCALIVKAVTKLVDRLLSHTRLEARARGFVVTGLKVLLYVVTAVIVAQGLGINTSSLVALLSVFSLGLTLAAEEILGNFAGSLVLLTSRPFAPGDVVESGGQIGTVQEITLHYTKLLNIDGQYILIPNKELAASRLINYTALGRRRVTVKISAAYDAPRDAVRAACHDALNRTERILPDPAPAVRLTDFGSNAVEYSVFCWVKPGDYLTVLYALNDNLWDAFARGGVEMSYDHMNVHIIENRSGQAPKER